MDSNSHPASNRNRHPLLSRILPFLWPVGKSLLILLQLLAIRIATGDVIHTLTVQMEEERSFPLSMFGLLWVSGIAVYMLWYYDEIDDRSFRRFSELTEQPSFSPIRTVPCALSFVLSLLMALVIFPPLVKEVLSFSSLSGHAVLWLSWLIPVAVMALVQVFRILSLVRKWGVQKYLTEYQKRHPPVWKRILLAVVFYVALLFFTVANQVFIPFFRIIWFFLWAIRWFFVSLFVILLTVDLIFRIRNLIGRKRFLHSLRTRQQEGELTFRLFGHPYLSVFCPLFTFSLTVKDNPYRDEQGRCADPTPVIYQVAVARCRYRRFVVYLCENHVYQFEHALRIQKHITLLTWYTSHSLRFPDGEGKKIVLLDPVPHHVGIRGAHTEEDIGHASQVYDYMVFGKTAFLHHLERT